MDNIEAKTLESMAYTENKTHEEILAGWDALIKKIEDDRYNYFWDKGYDDYLHSRPFQERDLSKDYDAYHNGWIEAQDKFTKERR